MAAPKKAAPAKPKPKAASGKTTTIKSPGKKPVKFQEGGLHKSLGVPADQPIPAGKMADAKAGKYGPLAKKQASFAAGMLKAGRQTAARNRKSGGSK